MHRTPALSLSLVLLLGLAACGTSAPSSPSSTSAPGPAEAGSTRDISVAQLKADLESDKVPVLIDVRTEREFQAGHVPAARLLPLDQLQARLGELESHKGAPVYVICQSGGRSARAAQLLASNGFDAVNVQGGTGAWMQAGHDLSR